MPTTRREVLGAGASPALGALPAVAAPVIPGPSADGRADWDAGEVAHLLPTSSHDRILIKASFRQPLDGVPTMLVGDQRVPGQRTDTRGAFWQFQADELKPGTEHKLALIGGDGRALCQPWTLAAMPAPDDQPEKLRLLVYSCAGGHDLFAKVGTGFEFLSAAIRQRLLRRGLSFAPDALIANGDHVYWDLLAPRAAPKLGANPAALAYARFDPVPVRSWRDPAPALCVGRPVHTGRALSAGEAP